MVKPNLTLCKSSTVFTVTPWVTVLQTQPEIVYFCNVIIYPSYGLMLHNEPLYFGAETAGLTAERGESTEREQERKFWQSDRWFAVKRNTNLVCV